MASRRLVSALLGLSLLAALTFGIDSEKGRAGEGAPGDRQTAAPAEGWTYEPGRPYLSPSGYIEFVPGDAPVIVSAPHGGVLMPGEIPDRRGVTDRDVNTEELARLFAEEFYRLTGKRPHLVINLLHRKKLDANRPAKEAAEGNPIALEAWHEFHRYIEEAKAYALDRYGWGFYLDLHGHSHAHQRVELGYALSAETLRLPDEALNRYAGESTLQPVCRHPGEPPDLAGLLRGPTSLGTLLERRGVPSVPSVETPAPLDGWSFFSGGYNVRRHGALGGGTIHGVQVEVSRNWRSTPTALTRFARALAEATADFVHPVFEHCDYLRLRAEESGVLLTSIAIPKGASAVEVFLGDERFFSGDDLPEEIAVPIARLDQGFNEVAVEWTGAGGDRFRHHSQVYVRHFNLVGASMESESNAPATVRGALKIEVLPEHSHLDRATIELRRLHAAAGGASVELIQAERLPIRLAVETSELEDGLYELVVRAITSEGVEATESATLLIDNWEVLEDALLPPVESSWFGSRSRLKALDRTGEWEHATDFPERFDGDEDRLVAAGGDVHSLIWRLPNLHRVELTLYSQVDLEGRVLLEVSQDASTWRALPYEVEPAPFAVGASWRRFTLRGQTEPPQLAEYLRFTLYTEGLSKSAIQLAHVRLVARRL